MPPTKLDGKSTNGSTISSEKTKEDTTTMATNNGFCKSSTVKNGYNSHLNDLDVDVLYHLSMDTKSHDFKKIFGDVKFVCCGGSANRIRKFATNLKKFLHAENFDIDSSSYLDQNGEPRNFCENSDRYVVYKIGPVLFANFLFERLVAMGNSTIPGVNKL
uniref:Uncharacterized protein n=1 Tax=Romanomermis culicivorax TaxID=13658 RepID=A0A915JWR5_ROMCU